MSINTGKNYMQVDGGGNEELNSDYDDGGNKKNAACHLHRLRLLLLDRIWIAVGYV